MSAPTSASSEHEADEAIAKRRWEQALHILEREPAHDPLGERKRLFVANFAALRRANPALCDIVESAANSGRFVLAQTPDGLPAVAERLNDGTHRMMPTDHESSIAQAEAESTVLLAGIGDGKLAAALLERTGTSDGETGAFQAVLIVEPQAEALRTAMMVTDLRPAFSSSRVRWCVGDGWASEVDRVINQDVWIAPPKSGIVLRAGCAPVGETISNAVRTRQQSSAELRGALAERWRRRSLSWLIEHLERRAGEPGRVMLLSSRFTNVLRHSTRDAAEALDRLGYETRVVMEPERYHRFTSLPLLREAAEFDPHLVLSINHVRKNAGDVFPPELPFVCWIQDNFDNLIEPGAPLCLRERDFMIGAWIGQYALRHGYPERRCIAIPRATRLRDIPSIQDRSQTGHDLLYVSNHAATFERSLDNLRERLRNAPQLNEAALAAAGEIRSIYQRGQSCCYMHTFREITARALEDFGPKHTAAAVMHTLASEIYNVINGPMYRQQSLAWVADIAEKRGLSLGLYGNGWESNPRFAQHARGPVEYGEALARLTRASALTLVLEPFRLNTHQRPIDAWMAGGFVLRRGLLPRPPKANREIRRPVLAADLRPAPPDTAAFTFHTPDELEAMIDLYLDDPQHRRSVAERCRAHVLEHTTYDAVLNNALAAMCTTLSEHR